ncbi:helix-turn-helix domain-containing protein [Halorubrum sp. BOL3-1]|uniref:helix-turn-helix domain-containing protein n=1 Tax=Halorubrum sp. BOL3-1 TaxID=2497325 RepID=UPI002952956D|nr:helix-turn-helix domain-containing protein [Halorubrum sp. BOL3-1]
MCLRVIGEGPLSASEAADQPGYDRSTVTRYRNRLVDLGLLRRSESNREGGVVRRALSESARDTTRRTPSESTRDRRARGFRRVIHCREPPRRRHRRRLRVRAP